MKEEDWKRTLGNCRRVLRREDKVITEREHRVDKLTASANILSERQARQPCVRSPWQHSTYVSVLCHFEANGPPGSRPFDRLTCSRKPGAILLKPFNQSRVGCGPQPFWGYAAIMPIHCYTATMYYSMVDDLVNGLERFPG